MAGNRVKDTGVILGDEGVACAKCGKDNLPGSRFCCCCGAKIGQDAPAFGRADGAPRKDAEAARGKAKDEYVGELPAWDVLPPAITVVRRRRR